VDFAGVSWNGECTNKMSVQRSGDLLFKVEHNTNVSRLFDKLFGSFSGAGGAATGPSRNQKTKFLVDRVLEGFNTLARGPKLSVDDRAVLQAHVESINAIQKSVVAMPQVPISCSKPQLQIPTTPIGGIANPYGGMLKPNDVFRLAIKIIAAGLRCDLTRVATVNFSPDRPDDWNAGGFHGVCHDTSREYMGGTPLDGPNQKALLAAQRWQASLVADMMTELDGFTDPNGLTALDNSLLFWSNAMGDVGRQFRDGHGGNLLRAFFAGSAGGTVNAGRFLQYFGDQTGTYPGYEKTSGPMWNHLLISIMRAFGLPNAEFQTDASGGFASYTTGNDTLWGNTFRGFVGGINNDRAAVLPGFLR
jgi:hypothetical protein